MGRYSWLYRGSFNNLSVACQPQSSDNDQRMRSVMMPHLFNDGKDPCPPIVISIRSHTEIDLLWEWIGIASGRQLENAIHHDDGSICGKGLMKVAHLSGGARGTSCQSSAEQIESLGSWMSQRIKTDRPT